jgi:hypothetical protein
MYGQLADAMVIYLEFENLFDLFALSKSLKHKFSPKKATLDLKYFLDQYSLPRPSISENLPGKFNVKQFEHRCENQTATAWIPFCGGVNMNIKLSSRNFRRDTTGKLSRRKKAALKARPNPQPLFWEFKF